MIRSALFLAVAVCATSAGYGLPAETAASFNAYKKDVLKDPALIRYYTFEEGYGPEVTNHAALEEPGRIALTGGPAGSLTICNFTPYGTMGDWRGVDIVPTEWTTGRFPGKSAVRSGDVSCEAYHLITRVARGLYRSGVTGREFNKGMTIFGWFRFEPAPGFCTLFRLGDAKKTGFKLTYGYTVLQFQVGTLGKTTKLEASGCEARVWHFIAVTVGDGAARLYVDGKLAAEKPYDGAITPVAECENNPSCVPFIEKEASFGTYLQIAENGHYFKNRPCVRLHLDELAIYGRVLPAAELDALFARRKSADGVEEERAQFAAWEKRQAVLDQIKMDIPRDTDGYFRVNEPIPATISLPAECAGAHRATMEIVTLAGKPVQTRAKQIAGGETMSEHLRLPACGVYWLDMKVEDADGKLVKRLPQKFCLGVIPPAPKELSDRNPMAYWADKTSAFHYDTPLRRFDVPPEQFIEHFERQYADYCRRIPNFRPYLIFGAPYTIKPPKEGWEAGRRKNRAYFTNVVKHLEGKKFVAFEMTSEPHGIDPKWYVQFLADAREILDAAGFRQPMIPPGGAPPSIPMISDILKAGGDKYMDGLSYHPYTARPIETYLFSHSIEKLKEISKPYNKKFRYWNTECGILSLPRINYRPMTRDEAFATRWPSRDGDFLGAILAKPEEEAAQAVVQDVLLDLLAGYDIYTHCQRPHVEGNPCLNSVALTAMAGQILNEYDGMTRLPLAGAKDMCLLIKQADGSRIAAVFGEKPTLITLRLEPNTAYRTMDLYGNYGSLKTDGDGLLSIASTPAPFYVFGVPETIAEVVPLKLTLPETISDRGELTGRVTVTNPYRKPLKGVLAADDVHGAVITLKDRQVALAPGGQMETAFVVKGTDLKRRTYGFGVTLKDETGRVVAAASGVSRSPGMIRMVPQARGEMPLDGDETKWAGIPALTCDTVENVVHGKPNYAEVWLPQWLGKDDLSFTVQACWRKGDGIYFLLRVKDDVVMPAAEEKTNIAFAYDCLEFFFDSRPAQQQGTVFSPGADQTIIIPRNTPKATACDLWHARRNNEHIKVTCVGKRTADGWLLEGKVEPNERSEFRIQAGSQFRMDFLVDDTDRDDLKWRRKSAMAVDGNFANSMNSDVWGRYELSLDAPRAE